MCGNWENRLRWLELRLTSPKVVKFVPLILCYDSRDRQTQHFARAFVVRHDSHIRKLHACACIHFMLFTASPQSHVPPVFESSWGICKENLLLLTDRTTQSVQQLQRLFESRDPATCSEMRRKVEDEMLPAVLETINHFSKAGSQQSATFANWSSFLDSGDILLRLLRADRDSNGNSPLLHYCWAPELLSIYTSLSS